MWKQLWRTWTVDKPAAFGDWLWQICVVELAALLDRLTLRQIIAFIPVVILIVAYTHRIPIPPELILVGDVLAYLDIFSVFMLLSLVGRASTILYVLRRAIELLRDGVNDVRDRLRRVAAREPGTRRQRRPGSRVNDDHEGPVPRFGFAWA
jgi:hypothetical protein